VKKNLINGKLYEYYVKLTITKKKKKLYYINMFKIQYVQNSIWEAINYFKLSEYSTLLNIATLFLMKKDI